MEHFLVYLIVSSIVTLISIMFAYKPDNEELLMIDVAKSESDGQRAESAPVYSDEPMKTSGSKSNNALQASMY